MSETTVNVPLLRKAVEWAEAEAAKPYEIREWDQRRYVIPTGPTDPNVIVGDDDAYGPHSYTRGFAKSTDCGTCFCVAGYVAHLRSTSALNYDEIEGIASRELGLSGAQAEILFHPSNSITEVRTIAESIAGERL